MEAGLIARIGLSRLRLPVPGAKWLTVNSLARALRDPATQRAVWGELLTWLASLDLEAEVVEALAVAVLAKDVPIVSRAELQAAIRKPSPLSDIFLGQISDQPLLINSWSRAHSGEVIPVFVGAAELDELKAGRIIPPILSFQLRSLERLSGKPFLKQWAFEFRALRDRLGEPADGHWQYFSGDSDRDGATGQFITRRGQLARSAYLRTLALAFDVWDMPLEDVYEHAMHATPTDFLFLPAPPGPPPAWAAGLRDRAPISDGDWSNLASELCSSLAHDTPAEEVIHLNVGVAATATYQAEIEVVSLLQEPSEIPPGEVFDFHDRLPGRVELERSDDWRISITPHFVNESLHADGGTAFRPVLLPASARFAGYFQFDLWRRMPYLPANYSNTGSSIVAEPREGALDLRLNGALCGCLSIWHDRWKPTHHREMSSHLGVGVTVRTDHWGELLSAPPLILKKYWRATVMQRERSHSEWSVQRLSGHVRA